MPFSANSPEGRITLLGVDPQSVEVMRVRNRKERCYTAKCCGAPLSIRVAEGKVAHFVHQVTPANCDGEKRETPEHRRLKQVIAEAVLRTWAWEVETEAREPDPDTGRTHWQADVLAFNARSRVAFEVQLSNSDYGLMRERQARYQASKVRGLWFVRTKKGFPLTKELPIFTVESSESGDWVQLSTRWDRPEVWSRTEGADWMELSEFIGAALDKRLKWAPYLNKPETELQAEVHYSNQGVCPGCGRTVVSPWTSAMYVAKEYGYPEYWWHDALSPQRRTRWHGQVVKAVWAAAKKDAVVALASANGTCLWCNTLLDKTAQAPRGNGTLTAELRLGDFPPPAFGTVERDWLQRWYVMGE